MLGAGATVDANDAIRMMIETSGKSGRQVAREIGRSESFISSSLAQDVCPRTDTLARIARACGYELVVVPRHNTDEHVSLRTSIVIEYDSGSITKNV
jgi:ribosome-binding protein aMBF1 (putative translation factor)